MTSVILQGCVLEVYSIHPSHVSFVVSRYSRLSFVLDICTELAVYLQFMILFLGIIHIFMFSLILYSRYSHFVN